MLYLLRTLGEVAGFEVGVAVDSLVEPAGDGVGAASNVFIYKSFKIIKFILIIKE